VWLRGEAPKVGGQSGVDLRLHVGIASGAAIGGVTGSKRLSCNYRDNTVNLAAQLQDSVAAHGISASELVWLVVGDS
jgi:adenylate cyclase